MLYLYLEDLGFPSASQPTPAQDFEQPDQLLLESSAQLKTFPIAFWK